MILDIRSLEPATCIDADVCIVGVGPAGIALARAFIGSGIQICLLESGGRQWSKRQQDLYRGRKVGRFFMEHPHTYGARLTLSKRALTAR